MSEPVKGKWGHFSYIQSIFPVHLFQALAILLPASWGNGPLPCPSLLSNQVLTLLSPQKLKSPRNTLTAGFQPQVQGKAWERSL